MVAYWLGTWSMPSSATEVSGIGSVTGGAQVNFSDNTVRQYAREIAQDEAAHVQFLRTALGSSAVAQPAINISGDATKHGFSSDELIAAAAEAATLPRVCVRGLMAMSGLESNHNQTRQQFAAVRMLLEELNTRCVFPEKLTELSMGMSHDFEVAVEEGATLVRVGSAIFGDRTYA